jgi:hypothetical protein
LKDRFYGGERLGARAARVTRALVVLASAEGCGGQRQQGRDPDDATER